MEGALFLFFVSVWKLNLYFCFLQQTGGDLTPQQVSLFKKALNAKVRYTATLGDP